MTNRRIFLQTAGLAVCGAAGTLIEGVSAAEEEADAKVENTAPPTEQIMHQHGLIQRLILTYDEVARRLQEGEEVPGDALNTGTFVTQFIENYHEQLEEEYIFPIYQEAGEYTDLIKTLGAQHKAGQQLAARIYFLAGKDSASEEPVRTDLARALREYGRMYRAHAAFEDTILMPTLREVIAPEQLQEITRQFRRTTERKLGDDGLDGVLKRLQPIEDDLGIGSLDSYTVRVDE